MASPLILALQQIATDWEGLIPETDPERTFFHLDEEKNANRIDSGSASGDRAFVFEDPVRDEPEMENGSDNTLLAWLCVARVGLSSAGLTYWAALQRAVNEPNQLARAIERRSQWPDGRIASVVTEGIEVGKTEAGDRVAEITFRVTCWEDD